MGDCASNAEERLKNIFFFCEKKIKKIIPKVGGLTLTLFPEPPLLERDQIPVCSGFNQAVSFCESLNKSFVNRGGWSFSLPTEAQWEYACRAGTVGEFGGNNDLDSIGWFLDNSDCHLHPVGQKSPNDWGLFDMHGNIAEYCRGRIKHYSRKGSIDPCVFEHSSFCIRGGDFKSSYRECRSAHRNASNKTAIGFRPVLTKDDLASFRYDHWQKRFNFLVLILFYCVILAFMFIGVIIGDWYNITVSKFVPVGLLLLISFTGIFFLVRNIHRLNREKVPKPKTEATSSLVEYDEKRFVELIDELKKHYSEEYYAANRKKS